MRAPEPQPRPALKDALAAIVREAGALAESYRGSELKFWTKHGDSPVSEADIAVDKLLRERLTELMPDCGWLSEETEDDRTRLGSARLWVVDPIDGTRAYVNGRTDWSISVALVENGRPTAGAVYAPLEDGLYLAFAGQGATRDGVALAASRSESFEQARAAGPKPMLAELSRTEPGIIQVPKVHSLALRLARVASGELDVAFASKSSHDWDVAAADIIVRESGGAFTTLAGEPAVYNRSEVRHAALIAAGPARHARVVALTRSWR